MIPSALVTGFLGSGKTTFLKRFTDRNLARRIVYLVNEFSPRDVDAALVAETGAENVVSVPGGSIFCQCLAAEFIRHMGMVAERWGDAEGLVIEASGMANPKVMTRMLAESGLDAHFTLASIVAVVDPANFLKLCSTLPNIVSQVEAADHVLLNKVDACGADLTDQAESRIRSINPRATLFRTVRCDAAVDLFTPRSHDALQGDYAKCRDPNYATFSTARPFAPAELAGFAAAFGESIFRIKGWLSGQYVDYSSHGFEFGPQATEARDEALVWIVKGQDLPAIKDALHREFGCPCTAG